MAYGLKLGVYSFLKIDFIFILIMCVLSVSVGLYMWVQVPVESRGVRSPGGGVTGSCEPPSVGDGSQT